MESVNDINVLFLFIIFTVIASISGSALTSTSPWYWNNPDVVTIGPGGQTIGIVWTILFVLLIVASYWAYIWQSDKRKRSWIIVLFALYLLFNVAWTYVYFQLANFTLAYIINIILILIILGLMYVSEDLLIIAAFVPNLLWLLNALYLTYQTSLVA